MQSHLPLLRPITDSSNACNQTSAPIVCTPLHGLVQFAIIRGVWLVGHVFPKNCPFPFGDRHLHITHCSSANPTHHPNGISIGSAIFEWVPNAMLYNGEENLQNCRFPLGFRHPARERTSHHHRQHAQKFGKDRACGSGDIITDRQTGRHRDTQTCLSQYFATAPTGEVMSKLWHKEYFTDIFYNVLRQKQSTRNEAPCNRSRQREGHAKRRRWCSMRPLRERWWYWRHTSDSLPRHALIKAPTAAAVSYA